MDGLDRLLKAHLPRYLNNEGHGLVWPRPDGKRYRCGGRRFCEECKKDAADLAAARRKAARQVDASGRKASPHG